MHKITYFECCFEIIFAMPNNPNGIIRSVQALQYDGSPIKCRYYKLECENFLTVKSKCRFRTKQQATQDNNNTQTKGKTHKHMNEKFVFAFFHLPRIFTARHFNPIRLHPNKKKENKYNLNANCITDNVRT